MDFLAQAGASSSLNASVEFKKMSRRATSYQELYNEGVKFQDFNIMLTDNSFFQFTEKKADEDVRLAYYPNPYKFVEYLQERKEALSMLDSNELSLPEYEQLMTECNTKGDVPLIRYDLSVDQHCKKYHPAAHFHIGFHTENRWAVNRVLTPYAFFLKILIHYYPSLWFDFGDRGDELDNILDLKYREELSRCSLLSNQYFLDIEKDRLHFT